MKHRAKTISQSAKLVTRSAKAARGIRARKSAVSTAAKIAKSAGRGAVVRVIDNKGRLVLPHAKPGQPMAITVNGDGSLTITPLKPTINEPFPPGSLFKEVEEMNTEWAGVKLRVPAPPKEWE